MEDAVGAEAAAVVVVSREMETHLLELGFPRERLHYNVYGVDVERFTPAAPDQAPPHFFGVGRFSDKKAPHLTLLAFARALGADARPAATPGALRSALAEAMRAAEVDGRPQVVVAAIDPHEVPPYGERFRSVAGRADVRA